MHGCVQHVMMRETVSGVRVCKDMGEGGGKQRKWQGSASHRDACTSAHTDAWAHTRIE